MARQMGCTVRELGQRLGRDEATEWMAYERVEPGLPAYLHGILSALATLCSALGNKRAADDFLPRKYQPPKPPQTFSEACAFLAARYPGQVVIASQRTNG